MRDFPTFDAALAGARGGDGRAFAVLFHAFAQPVAAYLRARAVEDPDGAVNEVFLRVFGKIATFHGDEPRFRSWVFAIAHNRAVDEHRSRARRVACDAIDAHVATLRSPSHALDDAVAGRAQVDELLAVLTDDQRDVVLLRFVADLSIEETAQTLDKPVTAVKALQRRALDALRRHIVGNAAEYGVIDDVVRSATATA